MKKSEDWFSGWLVDRITCLYVKSLAEDIKRWFHFHYINIAFNKTTFIFWEASRCFKKNLYKENWKILKDLPEAVRMMNNNKDDVP